MTGTLTGLTLPAGRCRSGGSGTQEVSTDSCHRRLHCLSVCLSAVFSVPPGGRALRLCDPGLFPGPCLPVSVSRSLFPPSTVAAKPPGTLFFCDIFVHPLTKNHHTFGSEHFSTCPNFYYLDILLSLKYLRHFPLTRNVNFHADDFLGG